MCELRCVARCPVPGVQDVMQSEWSACPPDVLQQCLSAQPDYLDNAAAACVSKLWRDTFRCARKLDIVYSALRLRPRSLYLCQFSQVTSVTLRRFPVWQVDQPWLGRSAVQGYQEIAPLVWTDVISSIPASCCALTLDRVFLNAYPGNNSLSQSLSQLTNLRRLKVQDASGAINVEPLSACSSLDTFEVPDKFGVNTLVGSLQALPSSITKLQLRNCEAEGGNLLKLEVLSQLQSLNDLELSNSRFDFGKLCTSRALSQLTRLVVQCNSVLQYHDVLHLSALQVLHLQCSCNVFNFAPDVTWLLSDILCHLRCL